MVIVVVVVIVKYKSVVIVGGYKIEAMISSGGGHKRPIDGCGRCLRNGKHRLWVLVVVQYRWVWDKMGGSNKDEARSLGGRLGLVLGDCLVSARLVGCYLLYAQLCGECEKL